MIWLADQVGIQDMGNAQARAFLHSVYGDGIKFPDTPRQIAGGRIDDGQHIHIPSSIAPKSNPWPWIAAIVAMLLAAGIWYLTVHPRPAPMETLTPGASKIGISVTPGS